MEGSFWLRNMIVLGQGAPNSIRKIGGQQGRCICLWSEEKGYCRIYPVPYGYIKDWEIVDVEVRKPSNDGRENSFVIFNYEGEWPNLSKRIFVHKKVNKQNELVPESLKRDEWISLTRRLAKDVFSEIRDNKKSFGIIKPASFKLLIERNREKSEAQMKLTNIGVDDLDNLIMNQNDYAFLPYVEYSCEGQCNSKHPHRSKLVEWGAYQWMKKSPSNYEHCKKLIDNFHISDEDYEHYLLIGNIRQYPKTYIIVKIIRFKVDRIHPQKEV